MDCVLNNPAPQSKIFAASKHALQIDTDFHRLTCTQEEHKHISCPPTFEPSFLNIVSIGEVIDSISAKVCVCIKLGTVDLCIFKYFILLFSPLKHGLC